MDLNVYQPMQCFTSNKLFFDWLFEMLRGLSASTEQYVRETKDAPELLPEQRPLSSTTSSRRLLYSTLKVYLVDALLI